MRGNNLSVTVEDWENIYSLIQMKLSDILMEKKKKMKRGTEIFTIQHHLDTGLLFFHCFSLEINLKEFFCL